MKYHLNKDVMRDDRSRKSFNALAVKTFGLSFENWYQNGYWSDFYRPYTLFSGDTAVANISVNRQDVLRDGQIRRYIQLGTVMTDISSRNQGLSRYLMKAVMRDCEKQYDAMILFANKSVLDFYPKFGFQKEAQYRFCAKIDQAVDRAAGAGKKLNMNSAKDRDLLKRYYEKTNPFSGLQVVNLYGLLMFYCISPFQDFVFFSEQYDAVIIAEQVGEHLNCYDIYCDEGGKLTEILSSIARPGTKTIRLLFTPKDAGEYEAVPVEDGEDALFVLDGGENIFRGNKLLFPVISHT